VEAGNRLAHAIAGAAMSGTSRNDIVDVTGYSPERVPRILPGGIWEGIAR
jgi:hypothetical protein